MVENELNKLSENIKLASTKGLAKYLINEYMIHNGTKYFTEDCSQSYFIFQPLLKYFQASRATVNAKVMT